MFKSITAAAFTLSAIGIAAPAQALLDNQFRCEPTGDGEHLVTISAEDNNKASVSYRITSGAADGTESAVTQLAVKYNYPDSGARYVGGEYMLLITNSFGVLLYGIGTDKEGHTECTFAGEEVQDPDDTNVGPITLNVRAGSWGGKLRSGPSMKYEQIGSLYEGNRVTLLENTGIMMDGYPWFLLRSDSGKKGYQWGGILCATKTPVDGVFQNCP